MARLWRGFDAGVKATARGYRRLLARLLRLRWVVIALAGMVSVLSLQAFNQLGNEFLPQIDDGELSVRMSLPPGTPPDVNDAAARLIEREIESMPHVENVFAMVGGHLSGGVISERPGTASIAVRLSPASTRPDWPAGLWVQELQQRLDTLEIAGARLSVRPPSIRGLSWGISGTDLSIGIVGEELHELQAVGRDIVARLQGIPGLDGVEIGREERTPLLSVDVDRERAASLGVAVGDVGRALRDAVSGTVPTRFATTVAEYDVRVRVPRAAARDADSLGALVIAHGSHGPVLLRDVARFSLGEGPAHIERENQIRILRVNGDFNTRISDVGSIMNAVQEALADLPLPENSSLIFGGQFEAIADSRREMLTVISLAAFLVFVVLAVQYERLSNPLVIMCSAPLALVGVVAMLWATATPVSSPALIGMVLLIGIVVNNAILLVEYVEQGRKRGLSVSDAVIEAGGVRLRPILMTTLTTVVGMLPLAIGMGAGADMMQPLALTVVGGLLAGMFLTLLLIPCMYTVVHELIDVLRRRLLKPAPQETATG